MKKRLKLALSLKSKLDDSRYLIGAFALGTKDLAQLFIPERKPNTVAEVVYNSGEVIKVPYYDGSVKKE